MKTDQTTDPTWVREQQSRLVGWEILQRALDGKADEPLDGRELREVLRRCGYSEEDYMATEAAFRGKMQEARKQL